MKQKLVKFHLDKISLLRRELEMKKTQGEKRIWKEQLILEGCLQRIQIQINRHELKIKEIELNQS